MEVQKTWLSEWAEGRQESTATESAVEMSGCCGLDVKLEWSQRKMKVELEKELYDEDWKAELDIEAEVKQQKNESEIRGELKITSPDFSGARLAYNLALINSRADNEQAWDVEKKVNLSYEGEYHVGLKCKWDTKVVTEGWAHAVWTPKDQEDTAYWLRGDKN